MVKKKKPKQEKVSLALPADVAACLDRETRAIRERNPKSKPTRASVARALIRNSLLRMSETLEERQEANRLILGEAAAMKLRGKTLLNEGHRIEAQSAFLTAAARELEALAILETESESVIKTTIIETLVLLKAATGYRRLPDVPLQKDPMQRAEG